MSWIGEVQQDFEAIGRCIETARQTVGTVVQIGLECQKHNPCRSELVRQPSVTQKRSEAVDTRSAALASLCLLLHVSLHCRKRCLGDVPGHMRLRPDLIGGDVRSARLGLHSSSAGHPHSPADGGHLGLVYDTAIYHLHCKLLLQNQKPASSAPSGLWQQCRQSCLEARVQHPRRKRSVQVDRCKPLCGKHHIEDFQGAYCNSCSMCFGQQLQAPFLCVLKLILVFNKYIDFLLCIYRPGH